MFLIRDVFLINYDNTYNTEEEMVKRKHDFTMDHFLSANFAVRIYH